MYFFFQINKVDLQTTNDVVNAAFHDNTKNVLWTNDVISFSKPWNKYFMWSKYWALFFMRVVER